MNASDYPSELRGADLLVDWFGRWPSFHDAEIVSVSLNRRGASKLSIHAFQMTGELNDKGHYVNVKHAIVTFEFDEVVNLNLSGFNRQNVIFGLSVAQSGGVHKLSLDQCYGLAGEIEGTGLKVSFEPGMPSNSIYGKPNV